jgi:hypothetical protein
MKPKILESISVEPDNQSEAPEEEYSEGESSFPIGTSLRLDAELFKEEDNKKHKLINVRRAKLPKNGEDWEIIEDGKVMLVLKGNRFTSKERDFFKTVDGIKFIMEGWKSGWKSVSRFKEELKKYD